MRRFLITFGGVAIFAAIAAASTISCNFNNAGTTNVCYGQGATFSSNDSINFLTGFGSASTTSSVYPYDVIAHGALSGGSTVDGVGVTVSLGPGGSTQFQGPIAGVTSATASRLSRYDNTQDAYEVDGTSFAGWVATNSYHTYAGQFSAPNTPTVSPTEAHGDYGDYLLGPTSGSSGANHPDSAPLIFNFATPVAGIAFDISSVSAGATPNTNFTAEVDAYDGNTFLGYYYLSAPGLGGVCSGLTSFGDPTVNNPIPCNDAPQIGFSTQYNTITKIVIDAVDQTGDHGFFVGNMLLAETTTPPGGGGAPEPASLLITGCGLVAGGALFRKRSRGKG